jgi:hypothetical protein
MFIQRTTGIIFRDFLFLAVIGFVAMVQMMYPLINDPNKQEEDADPVGNIVVSVSWPVGDIDIDTWVFGPGETRPIGYSNRNGKVFSLIKDDLGNPDADLNYESVISRGTPAGRYWVNLHAFRASTYPIKVKVTVDVHTGDNGKGMKKIVTTEVVLDHYGDERTAFSFELTDKGALVPGTTNNVFKPLRAANSGAL